MAETTDEKEGGGSYSPYLAQLLKIDPDRVSSISLSALGRQALGADTQEYQAAKAEVDKARAAMEEALANRQSRFDPSMLALAQGFLAPTRTGSFGESLGTAVGKYQEAQRTEQDRAAQLAKMRYDLANTKLAEEREAAKLGLQVASKLTPQLTNLQRQVQAEGIDPRSPEGINRLKELYALDKATPEMKEFAARQGIPLTDPTFASRFQMFKSTEPLRAVATRLGLDLNTPEGQARAREELQREQFRTANPEVAKKLQSFGGDPLNPKDVARAQAEVRVDTELERTGKRTTIAAQQAQTTRTRQEIDEHIRMGNVMGVAATAQNAGVPLDPKFSYMGLNPKEAAAKRTKDLEEADKYIRDKVAPFVANIDDDLTNLRRALQLNSEVRTGFKFGLGMGVGEGAKLLSGDRAKLNELDSLAALAAKQNRIPGDSNVSNADLAFMRLGTFSTDKETSTNENIIKYLIAQRERDRDYNAYLAKFAAVNGAITPYAQDQWRKYLNANPITARVKDPATGREKLTINPNRMTYEQYFSMPRVRVDAQGREVPQ